MRILFVSFDLKWTNKLKTYMLFVKNIMWTLKFWTIVAAQKSDSHFEVATRVQNFNVRLIFSTNNIYVFRRKLNFTSIKIWNLVKRAMGKQGNGMGKWRALIGRRWLRREMRRHTVSRCYDYYYYDYYHYYY